MLHVEDGARLDCTVAVERVSGASTGHVVQRRVLRRAAVTLGRDEFRELVLRVQDARGGPHESFALRSEFRLFTRFVKDGKCTVNFSQNNTQLLISDCPPDHLKTFLKTLSIKHEATRGSNPVSERARMRASVPRSFEIISPVQQKDIQKANELRRKVNTPVQVKVLGERAVNKTVNRQQVKRPRTDGDTSPVR